MNPFVALTLATILQQIAEIDPSNSDALPVHAKLPDEERYARRNRLIWSALALAGHLGYGHGGNMDWEDESRLWLVVYIELPTGQVSWHIPVFGGTWDGHKTDQKYARIREYVSTVGGKA